MTEIQKYSKYFVEMLFFVDIYKQNIMIKIITGKVDNHPGYVASF